MLPRSALLCLQLSFSVPASVRIPVCRSVCVCVLCVPLCVHLGLPSECTFCSFSKYVLNTYDLPGIALGAGDSAVNKADAGAVLAHWGSAQIRKRYP